MQSYRDRLRRASSINTAQHKKLRDLRDRFKGLFFILLFSIAMNIIFISAIINLW